MPKILLFNSIVWLWMLPSFGVKWYSSLVKPITLSPNPFTCLVFFLEGLSCSFRCLYALLLAEIETSDVVLPLRLIKSRVIPSWNLVLFIYLLLFESNDIVFGDILIVDVQLTDPFAQCAYARILSVPLKFALRTFFPISRCHKRALYKEQEMNLWKFLFNPVAKGIHREEGRTKRK